MGLVDGADRGTNVRLVGDVDNSARGRCVEVAPSRCRLCVVWIPFGIDRGTRRQRLPQRIEVLNSSHSGTD